MRALVPTVVVLAALTAEVGAQTTVQPDDSGFRYTEYVQASVDAVRARFDRATFAAVANQHSPGTRINFRTDATSIDATFEYLEACTFDGCGLYRLEVDGFLLPGVFGLDNTSGLLTETIYTQPTPVLRNFSLLLPYATDVDFLGLELTGGSESLSPPPYRPGLTWAAYGDSITQGFNAGDIARTYPYLAARDLQWSVINVGFAGQVLDPADATPLANLDADVVTVAIGTNNYWAQTTEVDFKDDLVQFIGDFRLLQPDTLLAFIVPPWVDYEKLPNSLGLITEDYRNWMRELVVQRARFDHRLVLFEGFDMIPQELPFFDDGLHPSDLGFVEYGSNLADLDVVRNGGFEVPVSTWQLLGTSVIDGGQRSSGTQSLRIGPNQGTAYQLLTGIEEGLCYELSFQSLLDDLGDQGSVAVRFLDTDDLQIEAFDLDVTWDTYQPGVIPFTAPEEFATVRLWAGKPTGPGTLFVDDLSIRLVEPASHDIYGCSNPQGSLRITAGRPGLGEALTLGIDNPLGTQTPGASVAGLMLAFAPDPNFPCGTLVPGLGMEGPGALGEILIHFLPPSLIDPILIGGVWQGPGFAAPVDLLIPDLCALAGFSVYAQGFLFDSSPGAQPQIALTEAIRLRLGP